MIGAYHTFSSRGKQRLALFERGRSCQRKQVLFSGKAGFAPGRIGLCYTASVWDLKAPHSFRVTPKEAAGIQRELAALVEIDCPGVTDTQRVGAWIEPDPAPDLAVEEVNLSGTPADPEAIRHFLSYFRLCD